MDVKEVKRFKVRLILKDRLFMNSVWLMGSTAILAITGFIFWTVAARHYSPDTIGIISTLISSISFLSTICLLGLNVSIINHMPRSKSPNVLINSAFSIVTVVSVIAASIFLLFAKSFFPKLAVALDNKSLLVLFILFATLTTVDTVLEGVFIAYKTSLIIIIKNLFYSILKLLLIFYLINLGQIGLLSAYYLGLVLADLIGYFYIRKRFSYRFTSRISLKSSRKVLNSSFGNYVESLTSVLPLAILPLLITTVATPTLTAYFYIDMVIAAVLYAIPKAVTRNMIAEISGDLDKYKHFLKRSILILLAVLIPISAILILFGKEILGIFGSRYAHNGYALLVLLTMSCFIVAANSLYWASLNVFNSTKHLWWINAVSAVFILGGSYLLLSHGLIGIGIAWIVGQVIQLTLYTLCFTSIAHRKISVPLDE